MVFVTGGTGLVGARLIFDLLGRGETVTALIRPKTTKGKFLELVKFYTPVIEDIENKINWVEGDLLDYESLVQLIEPRAMVYHCAAEVSFNAKKSKVIFETNVDGTANLVNACLLKGVEKFCHVSSIGALGGKINGQKTTEDTPWSATGKSAYSLSKYNAELEVWRGIAEGLNAVIVNPAVILGAGNWNHGSPQLFSRVAAGQKYYTLGSTSYVDVRDVTSAMVMLMESDVNAERFILAAETLTIQQLFTQIAQAIHAKTPQKYASKFVTALAYRLEKVRSLILMQEPQMTKQTHKISHACDDYSGKKICERLNFKYTPINKTIEFVGTCFLNHSK